MICQLFHLNDHLFYFFCFDLFLHHTHLNGLIFLLCHLHLHLPLHSHFHFHFHFNSYSHFHFHSHFYFLFLLLIFHFHFLMTLVFYQLKLYLTNRRINSFCPGISLLCFISEFFIMFNVFKRFLASISLIVLFLILLTKSLMSI